MTYGSEAIPSRSVQFVLSTRTAMTYGKNCLISSHLVNNSITILRLVYLTCSAWSANPLSNCFKNCCVIC